MMHTDNLLGALAVALSDEILQVTSEELGRGPSSVAALLSIGERPGSSIRELSRVVGTSHSATVRIVDVLELDGLARRDASAGDGRQVELFLTTAGQERYDALRQTRLAALTRHLDRLSPGDRTTLHRLLEELLSSVASDVTEARHVCRFCDHGTCRGAACPVGRPFL